MSEAAKVIQFPDGPAPQPEIKIDRIKASDLLKKLPPPQDDPEFLRVRENGDDTMGWLGIIVCLIPMGAFVILLIAAWRHL